jgi:hypothetical protein
MGLGVAGASISWKRNRLLHRQESAGQLSVAERVAQLSWPQAAADEGLRKAREGLRSVQSFEKGGGWVYKSGLGSLCCGSLPHDCSGAHALGKMADNPPAKGPPKGGGDDATLPAALWHLAVDLTFNECTCSRGRKGAGRQSSRLETGRPRPAAMSVGHRGAGTPHGNNAKGASKRGEPTEQGRPVFRGSLRTPRLEPSGRHTNTHTQRRCTAHQTDIRFKKAGGIEPVKGMRMGAEGWGGQVVGPPVGIVCSKPTQNLVGAIHPSDERPTRGQDAKHAQRTVVCKREGQRWRVGL